MVKPGTHLVKNHEAQSKTNEFQCNQTVNLKTDSRTLYYSMLKLKYIPWDCGGGGGGGYCHIWAFLVCAAVKGMVFKQFTLG